MVEEEFYGETTKVFRKGDFEFTQWKGARCCKCDCRISVQEKRVIRANGIKSLAHTTLLCGCGITIVYANGLISTVSGEKFRPMKMIFDNIAGIPSAIALKIAGEEKWRARNKTGRAF